MKLTAPVLRITGFLFKEEFMRKEEKIEVVKEMAEKLKGQKNLLLVDFSGIKGNEVATFRKVIKKDDIYYKVVKTSLLERALKKAGFKKLDESLFKGSVGVALSEQEPVMLVKKFVELKNEDDKPIFKIKKGLIEGKWISKEDIEKIAKLPSKEELLSKLVYLVQSPLSRLVTVFQKPERDFVVVLGQIKDKKEEAEKAA